jgi:hypothetical protein
MARAHRRRVVHHRHHHMSRARNRRHRRNPVIQMRRNRRGTYYAPRRHRRRLNPSSFRSVGVKNLVVGGLWGTAGAIVTRAVPGYVASAYNTGPIGYLMNAITAVAASFLAGFFGPEAAIGAGIGGFAAIGLRIITDYGGGNIPGVSGDIDHLGFFVQGNMAIPANDSGAWLPKGRPMLSIVGAVQPTIITPAAGSLPAGASKAAPGTAAAAAAPSPAAIVNQAVSSGGSWRGGGRWS